MAIDLENGYDDLRQHVGHHIVVSAYGSPHAPDNIAIECEECGEVLLDFDRPTSDTQTAGRDDAYVMDVAHRIAVETATGKTFDDLAMGALAHAGDWEHEDDAFSALLTRCYEALTPYAPTLRVALRHLPEFQEIADRYRNDASMLPLDVDARALREVVCDYLNPLIDGLAAKIIYARRNIPTSHP